MTIDLVREILGWCTVINFGILLLWFGMIVLMRDFVYRTHSKFFKITTDQFNFAHYMGLAIFKVAVIAFNLVPYIALCIIG